MNINYYNPCIWRSMNYVWTAPNRLPNMLLTSLVTETPRALQVLCYSAQPTQWQLVFLPYKLTFIVQANSLTFLITSLSINSNGTCISLICFICMKTCYFSSMTEESSSSTFLLYGFQLPLNSLCCLPPHIFSILPTLIQNQLRYQAGSTGARYNNYLWGLPLNSLAVHSKAALSSNRTAAHCVQDHNDPLVLLSVLFYTHLFTVSYIYFILSEYGSSH